MAKKAKKEQSTSHKNNSKGKREGVLYAFCFTASCCWMCNDIHGYPR